MGISGTGGSLVSDSSGGFTGSQGSGGAVFNTGWGRLLITIISSSSSWGSVGTLLCLTLGEIKCLHNGVGVKAWLLPAYDMVSSGSYTLSCWVHLHGLEQLYKQLL